VNPGNFFAELKRRNVYKVAVAYAVIAWLLIQIATQTFPFFDIPHWAIRLVILLLILGLPIALVIAWAFELTPDGIKRTESGAEASRKRPRRRLWIFVVVCAGLLSAALFFLGRYTASPRAATPATAAKSIAVLPFENRSEDKANSYFADGIQDEILTRLAKIDDLKVISRTSTQRYKSSPDNLRDIAKQLGVGHVLEGSVQRSGDQVRVNVQLINAETDAHLWAEVYDRKVADIFAVQSEIAETIAKALRVKLSSREKEAVGAKPTENTEAYDAYLRGLAIWNSLDVSPKALEQMEGFYARAVQLDSAFALAWAHLSVIRTLTYAEADPSAEQLSKAKHALDSALRLQPGLGEAHFALGLYRYRALRDYDGALKAFDGAIEHGVHKSLSIEFSAYVKRRQGKWDEALALHGKSQVLDPRNSVLFSEQGVTYSALRRFPEARQMIDRAIEIMPRDPLLLAQKAATFVQEGEFEAAEQLLQRVPVDPQHLDVLGTRLTLWMCTRRFDDAIRMLEAALAVPESLPKHAVAYYRARLGSIRRQVNDAEGATRELTLARDELEALRLESDTGEGFLQYLIVVEALLGEKARVDAHAAKMQDDIARDAFEGPGLEQAIAVARTQLGESDAAIEIIGRLLSKPGAGALTSALLRADPIWDPLRGDPRFQELVGAKP
jgi:TolB-like protein/Tfp pilus assembly protein PilF